MAQVTREAIVSAGQNVNVQAFSRVLRQGESSQDDSVAYRMVSGGGLFDAPPWKHPYEGQSAPPGKAAGAHQFIPHTWAYIASKYQLEDFSPQNQELGTTALIAEHGALDDVIAGRLDEAIRKLDRVWVSLAVPKRKEEAPGIFRAYGGTVAGEDPGTPQAEAPPPAAADDPPPTQETSVIPRITEAKSMGIFAALIPILGQLLPQLIPVLSQGHDSAEAQKWQGTGLAIANTLQDATKTDNLVQAIAAMQTNADALAAAHAAINNLLPSLVEAGGGGIDGARKANTDAAQIPFYKQPSSYFLLGSLPLVYMLAGSVLFGWGGTTWSDDAKMMVATGILAVLAGGSAYFWGSSSGSQKKTDALTAK